MKKLYGSFGAKLIAVILLCCLVLVFLGSASAAILVYKEGGYVGDYQTMRERYIDNLGQRMLGDVGTAYVNGQLTQNNLNNTVFTGRDAFWFEILDAENQVLLTNYEGGETLWQGTASFEPSYSVREDYAEAYDDSFRTTPVPQPTQSPEVTPTPAPQETQSPEVTPTPAPQETQTILIIRDNRDQRTYSFQSWGELYQWAAENTVTVKGYLPDPLPSSYSEIWQLQILSTLYAWRYAFLWILGLSFLAGVLVFIFLLCAAGHRKNTDTIVPSFVERIPFDVFTVLTVLALAVCFIPLDAGWDGLEMLIVVIPFILAAGLLFLLWCMSFAVRVKLGTLWSGCLIAKLLRLLARVIKKLPLVWKWVLCLAVAAFVDLIFRMNAVWSEDRAVAFWFLFWLLAAAATLYAVLAFRRLRLGAKAIANGNMNVSVDDKLLIWDLKDHANDLNHIRDGLNDAVDQRLKSERFRTELITNVSHDIKTPLTSIVNYVDLLQKEEPQTEKQQEYLEVLSRQSGKLKKLIEDLIEASKASTGNLSVELQPCDLGILLDQTAGEYGEKLEKAGLELVLQKPETPVTVLADGRHLWRVFDNLLNNIVKYAQPGTRVYLSLQRQGREALVTFRNISREPLNISAQELTERFVQGDLSRHSDGNGLGLAIAMSLMRLQKGDLDIDLDGDLFKVTLRFPAQQ